MLTEPDMLIDREYHNFVGRLRNSEKTRIIKPSNVDQTFNMIVTTFINGQNENTRYHGSNKMLTFKRPPYNAIMITKKLKITTRKCIFYHQ